MLTHRQKRLLARVVLVCIFLTFLDGYGVVNLPATNQSTSQRDGISHTDNQALATQSFMNDTFDMNPINDWMYAGLPSITVTCADGYAASVDLNSGAVKIGGEFGRQRECYAGITKTISLSDWGGGALNVSVDYRAAANSASGANTTNFLLYVFDGTNPLFATTVFSAEGVDSGWRNWRQDLGPELSGHTSITLYFEYSDSWSTNYHATNWYDNITLYSGDTYFNNDQFKINDHLLLDGWKYSGTMPSTNACTDGYVAQWDQGGGASLPVNNPSLMIGGESGSQQNCFAGVKKSIDLSGYVNSAPTTLDQAFYYTSAPSWTDNTDEAKSAGGKAFTLLAAATDYAYFGVTLKFDTLIFYLQTLGSYGAPTWEYSTGGGSWGALTVTDGTNAFSQNGTVTFVPPADWATDAVKGIGPYFWLRVKVASVASAATVYQIIPRESLTLSLTYRDYSTYYEATNGAIHLYNGTARLASNDLWQGYCDEVNCYSDSGLQNWSGDISANVTGHKSVTIYLGLHDRHSSNYGNEIWFDNIKLYYSNGPTYLLNDNFAYNAALYLDWNYTGRAPDNYFAFEYLSPRFPKPWGLYTKYWGDASGVMGFQKTVNLTGPGAPVQWNGSPLYLSFDYLIDYKGGVAIYDNNTGARLWSGMIWDGYGYSNHGSFATYNSGNITCSILGHKSIRISLYGSSANTAYYEEAYFDNIQLYSTPSAVYSCPKSQAASSIASTLVGPNLSSDTSTVDSAACPSFVTFQWTLDRRMPYQRPAAAATIRPTLIFVPDPACCSSANEFAHALFL